MQTDGTMERIRHLSKTKQGKKKKVKSIVLRVDIRIYRLCMFIWKKNECKLQYVCIYYG